MRQILVFFFSVFSLFSAFFFVVTTVLCTHAFSYNHEAYLLYSWLHSSPSPAPSHFSDWNIRDRNPCNWTSITCSPQGFVAKIDVVSVPLNLPLPSNLSSFRFLRELVMSDANLIGNITFDIGACSGLTVIDLSHNNLTGSIPASVGNLPNLETLALNSNFLSGEIPSELSNCTGLKYLVLSNNQLGGTIPPLLGKLSKLQVFRAGRNKLIAGSIPHELENCTSLIYLGLTGTSISGSLPASLGRLKKLQRLSVCDTMLSGKIPSEIGNCSELVELSLCKNNLSGSIPSNLGKLPKLQILSLWDNFIIGVIPKEFGNCTSLRTLELSMNSLSGTIPLSVGNLMKLEKFLVAQNNISGFIPSTLSNATNLQRLELYKNQISGLIPLELGRLQKLTQFYAWHNQLEGTIPSTLANLSNLQKLDLSWNSFTGSIPKGLFLLQNLTELELVFTNISGAIPLEIGSCSSLERLNLRNNRIYGEIPKTIGGLKNLNFCDISDNHLNGSLPDDIGGCLKLEMINLSNNDLEGPLPESLSTLPNLLVLNASNNKFEGQIPASLGHLSSLIDLLLSRNKFSGTIPQSLGLCSKLQMLDLSSNELTGSIPKELGDIKTLAVVLNLSHNSLKGPIPAEISKLNMLSAMDISHNMLKGDLRPLSHLASLVSLNISYNNFTGHLPDTRIFRLLSPEEIMGNTGLCSRIQDSCFFNDSHRKHSTKNMNSRILQLVIGLLVALIVTFIVIVIISLPRARTIRDNDSEMGSTWTWQFIPFQKLNFSAEQVLIGLKDKNIIGKGCSGVVHRVDIGNDEAIAVKKLWPTPVLSSEGPNDDKRGAWDSFSRELKILGLIRHRNIVKLLGYCWNHTTRLLMYEYMPNGSLDSLLHEREDENSRLEWEVRYRILLGVSQGLAYLHHDSDPPIVHRDIKPSNILIGPEFDACIADFGLAKFVDHCGFGNSSSMVAGSWGYIAPEYGYMMKITEKSDVYSFGVVMLEVLTGKKPIDPSIPDGLHIADWVRQKNGQVEVLDAALQSAPESDIEEMKEALGIALLCLASAPNQRPTMRDVATMIQEIKQVSEELADFDTLLKDSPTPLTGAGAETSEPARPSSYLKSDKASSIASSPRRSSFAIVELG
ncbi:receptor-like protein kinase 2 [Neltuma alba]|uniref:receptor-like protein kinase 2 n=1 Tax=Neltuma alba TaxID=207710 RepID=UPI0010A39ECC|nr:receptor-like protein kinase 2 [Prosopis alba]